jgi:hypothetical protein
LENSKNLFRNRAGNLFLHIKTITVRLFHLFHLLSLPGGGWSRSRAVLLDIYIDFLDIRIIYSFSRFVNMIFKFLSS